jgi:hypothetical protein
MTDPLIVVEGTLRLPSLRALADRPLTFGQEWLLAGSRPIRSRSEVSLYAARLFTEYVKAFALSDMRSPYQAASIWGVMTERLPSQLFERPLEPTFPQPASVAPGNGKTAPRDTINLEVQPPGKVEQSHSSRFPASAKTAIALACAALVAWLMLGHEKHSDDEPGLIAKQADSAHAPEQQAPASKPASMPASTPVVVAAQPQAASPAPEAKPATPVATIAEAPAAATVPAAALRQPQPASASEVASAKAVATPVNTRVARSGVVQKASADAQNRNLTPKQKAKLKREAQRLAAEQKRAARRTMAAQQAPVKHAGAQGAHPVASRVAQDDWSNAPTPNSKAAPARSAPPRLDAESLYPAPVQSVRASQKDWNGTQGASRAPARTSDAAMLYPAPAHSASAQNDSDNAPSSPRSPTRSRLDAPTLYPAPARSASAQSDWDNASSPLRAPTRNRPDAAALYPAPARSSAAQADRYSAPSYASAPVARSNLDSSYVPPARSAVPEAVASAASAPSAYARTLRSSARYASPTTKANDSLDVKSLYDMLQHSATLDDNVNVPVRAGSKASAK